MKQSIKVQEHGLGLIELMVAILIGLIVIAATASIWVTNKKSYSLQEDLGRIQENGRFAMEFIKYDIRILPNGQKIAISKPFCNFTWQRDAGQLIVSIIKIQETVFRVAQPCKGDPVGLCHQIGRAHV